MRLSSRSFESPSLLCGMGTPGRGESGGGVRSKMMETSGTFWNLVECRGPCGTVRLWDWGDYLDTGKLSPWTILGKTSLFLFACGQNGI